MTIEKHEAGSLAIEHDQYEFTGAQKQALVHIGVENASDGDLEVFFHVCKRTGLDPFAKQIYMLGRQTSVRNADGSWGKVTKQTIQTGIDGFRLIGRRAASSAHHTVSVDAPEWAHRDGTWRPVWDREWGLPLGARVTIRRAGEPFTAVALFDEYKQTKANGGLTSMWEQRPAGQLAKCAEALAWRMAFPQDLSGIYADEEMEQADSHVVVAEQVPDPRRVDPAAIAAQAESAPAPSTDQTPDPTEEMITEAQFREIGDRLAAEGVDKAGAIMYLNDVLEVHKIDKKVRARKELTRVEAEWVLESLRADFEDVEEVDGPLTPKDPAVDQPEDPWANVDVKQPPTEEETK
jgi:phage recombination protein Bet